MASLKGALPARHPARLIAGWFGVGTLPRAPGTWGSLSALPIGWLVLDLAGRPWLLLAAAVVFVVGWWASGVWQRATGESDPGAIVVDEVAGQLFILVAAPVDVFWFVAAFLIFRAFDIIKPFPVSWIDETVGGGLGVMLDDIVAAALGIILMIAGVLMLG